MSEKNFYNNLREMLSETLDYWGNDATNEDVNAFYDSLKDVLKDCPSFKLYKYMGPEYNSIRNLEKQNIFLSKNGDFNDIYEGLPASTLKENKSNDLWLLNDSAYISCFSESNDNILMWSHYADSSKGFCVEYDLKLIEKEKILNNIYPVVYQNKRLNNVDLPTILDDIKALNTAILNNEEYDENSLLNRSLPIFVTKSNEWEYEKEWRIVYTKNELYVKNQYKNISLLSQRIHFECVSGIYLGYRIDQQMKENILEIAERISKESQRKISVYEAQLATENYGIKFRKIEN